MAKIPWSGRIISIQPRIRLTRSFDERYHSYLGYRLLIDGIINNEVGEFSIGVGKATHNKFQFQVGDEVSGESLPVADKNKEPVDFYKTTKLKMITRSEEKLTGPPWNGVPDELPVYRSRGHRRLSAGTFSSKCWSCLWGCRMPVIIIVDNWNPEEKLYRFETFCYGPKSCSFYKPGPRRKVPGRRGMVWEEPDSVDEDATLHRGLDD